jgi:resuscitation-promoting factor RpfB
MSTPLPPPPEAPRRSTPFWKQWWFWAIVVVLILIAAGAGIAETTQTEAEAGSPSPATSATTTPSPTPDPTPETESVPDVDGDSVDDAVSELEAAGFSVSVETRLTNSAPKETVLRQSEPAGSLVEPGEGITLTIAEPLPKIPKVVGKTLANAKRALKNAGFEVGRVRQQTSGKRKGTVISQSPDARTSARPGRTVSLVTAKPAQKGQGRGPCTPGYSPCLPPASDYDCEGGTGDGPEYTGTVRVTGSDPYDLDDDNDGTGCD